MTRTDVGVQFNYLIPSTGKTYHNVILWCQKEFGHFIIIKIACELLWFCGWVV